MRAILCLTLALAAGCSTKSVCADFASSSCLAATVKGDVAKVDQIRVTIDFPSTASKDSPTTPTVLHLPVELAISLPAIAAGHAVRVFVEALSAGTSVATSAPWVGTAPAVGKPIDVTFELVAGGSDGGTTPDLGGVDASAPILVPTPSTLAFPDTAVDGSSTAFVSVTNPTASDVTAGTPTFTGSPYFSITPAPTSDAMGCPTTSAAKLGPGVTCHLYVAFAPTVAGKFAGVMTVPVTGGAPFTVQLVGNTRAFDDETIAAVKAANAGFAGVSGSSATDIYAVSTMNNVCAYHYDGTAWASVCNSVGTLSLDSVFALDATDVWVGGDTTTAGVSYSTNQGTSWQGGTLDAGSIMSGSRVIGLVAQSNKDVYGATSFGQVIRSNDGLKFTTFATPFGSPAGIDAIASNGTSLMVGGAAASVAFAPIDGPFAASYDVKGISASTTISSAWGDAASGHFYFITQTDETNPHWGLFRMDAGDTNATQLYALASAAQNLNGISGRSVPAAIGPDKVELYAVGGLGNTILHGLPAADGTLHFTLDALPTSDIMNAVWVGPTGEVVAVGMNGAIAHLH